MNHEKITTDHKEIRKWIEEHGGRPSVINTLNTNTNPIGLKVDFPGNKDEALLTSARPAQVTSWEQFFEIFEKQNLAFIYNKETNDKNWSYKFINRDMVNQ